MGGQDHLVPLFSNPFKAAERLFKICPQAQIVVL